MGLYPLHATISTLEIFFKKKDVSLTREYESEIPSKNIRLLDE